MSVPDKDKPHVAEFCHEINETAQPVYLETPLGQDGIKDCFVNVEKRIERSGGSVQYGWRIWEWSKTMIEGDFHAVWVNPEGTLVDVTPSGRDDRRILFVPDSNREYQGRQVNNIRKALFKNPLLTEFIELCDEQFVILNKGERANLNADPLMTADEELEFTKTMSLSDDEQARLLFIRHRKAQIQLLLSPCPCGGLFRYYLCCGRRHSS